MLYLKCLKNQLFSIVDKTKCKFKVDMCSMTGKEDSIILDSKYIKPHEMFDIEHLKHIPKSIMLITSPIAVHGNMFNFAMSTSYECNDDITRKPVCSSIIAVDDLYYKLSEQSKRFILMHEIAHFELHLSQKIRPKQSVYVEMDADELAGSIVGYDVALRALNEMYAIYPSFGYMTKRIKHMENISKSKVA